jgi:hypothetical protein
MPDKLADHRQRVSIAEEIEIVEDLKALAARQGKTLTDVYAEAARLLLEQEKTKKKKSPKIQ